MCSQSLDLEARKEIEARYGLTTSSSSAIGEGSGNTNYVLETNEGSLVLSIIEEQTFEEVGCMVQTLEWLDIYGYETSKIVKPRDIAGPSVFTLHRKPAFLRTHLSGEVCWNLTCQMLSDLGASIAKLHSVPSPDFVPDNIYYEQDQFKTVLDSNIDKTYEVWTKSRLKEIMSRVDKTLPRGLIHSDIFCDNVIFSDNELIAIIDFELACNYYLVFDLAMAIVGVCLADGQIMIAKVRSLIFGYEQYRKLSNLEIQALPDLMEYAALKTSVWRYWRYQVYEPKHKKRNAYLEMVSVANQISSNPSKFNTFA